MKLYSHPQVQILLNHLIDDYQSTKDSLGAFGEYTIAVASKSVENWLKQELVKKLGICSGIKFIPLYGLLHKIQKNTSQDQRQLVDKATLTSSFYKILTNINNTPDKAFENSDLKTIKNWLNEQNQAESLANLSYVLADVFELYQIYRTDWLDKWRVEDKDEDNKSNTETWQSALWRLLMAALPKDAILHRKELTDNFKEQSSHDGFSKYLKKFHQIMIFGISQIDVETIKQLKLINNYVPVSFLWHSASFNPFGSGDIENNVELVKEQEPYFSGNALLAAWGNATREQTLIFDDIPNQMNETDLPAIPKNLLQSIQQAIKNNTAEPNRSFSDCDSLDKSITLVSHFSRYREVEGLHDYLLDQMNQSDNNLKPDDIIVLCPDINAYSPYIRSVFDNQTNKKKLPYQICGMSSHADDVASLMLQLVSLPQTRYPLSEILDMLNHTYIRQKLDLTTDDVIQSHEWLKTANIHWGLDKKTITQLDLPEYDRYTLDCGIDRLVIGLALDGESINLANERLYGVEGISALKSDLLGKLILFVDALKQWRDSCLLDNGESQNKSMDEWCVLLRELTDQLIAVPQKELDSLNSWHQIISEINKTHETETIYSYAYLISSVTTKVEEATGASGTYKYGQVNIGSFGALKGTPAKVLALLGLNEADFPRKQKVDSINLTLTNPKFGDRNHTTQDKDAFLMSILSCSQSFYCSYVGKDIRTNSKRIPSLVLQELLDYIQPDGDKQEKLVQQHPMKPYSDKYFSGNPDLITYQDFNTTDKLLPGLENADDKGKLPTWNFSEQITIQSLTSFLEDPAKAFFKERFNINFPDIDDETSDQEPFESSGLTRWSIINELLETGMQTGKITPEMIETLRDKYLAKGIMENDSKAQESFKDCIKTVQKVFNHADKVKQSLSPTIEPVAVDIKVDGDTVKLVGDLPVYSDDHTANIIQLVQNKISETKEKYLMRTIVATRIAEAMKHENNLSYQKTFLVGTDGIYKLDADSGSGHTSLRKWLSLYKNVMNTPIAMDLTLASEISKKSNSIDKFRNIFDEVIAESNGDYGMRLSEALTLLNDDDQAIANGESYIDDYTYIKPNAKIDKENPKPQWENITKEMTNE